MKGWASFLLLFASACAAADTPPPAQAPWHELFSGHDLGAFVATPFGGEGPVHVRGDALHLTMGSPLSGITLTAGAPTGDYELEVIAARTLGNDFFCGITFPVGECHLTLVLGGWGGTVCGLSNLDGLDAASNHTRTLRSFALGRDYAVRIRVDAQQVATWIDEEPFVAIARAAHVMTLRNEMLPCVPFSISSFATEARIRRVRWRHCDGAVAPDTVQRSSAAAQTRIQEE